MNDRESREQRRLEKRELRKNRHHVPGSGGIWVGLLLLAVGAILLARAFGALFPAWLFTWPMILIVVGFFVGAKNNFRDFGWVIIVGIGIVFLLDRMYPEIPIHRYIWPVAIIGLGLIILISPRRRHGFGAWRRHYEWRKYYDINTGKPVYTQNTPDDTTATDSRQKDSGEEVLDIVSIFGGVNRNVFSKNFKGGEMVCIFGGGEISFAQADIQGTAVLEIIAIFGGVKLTVPSNWNVRSEINPLFGGIDDKRSKNTSPDPDKVLILKGALVFGGVDIRSY